MTLVSSSSSVNASGLSLRGLRCTTGVRRCRWSAILSLIQQKSHTGTHSGGGGRRRPAGLTKLSLLGSVSVVELIRGVNIHSSVSPLLIRPTPVLLKVASANVSLAKVSKLTTWARLEPITYQHLLITRKAIPVGWSS